ncbi:hypothetical protein Tco_0944912 [Tanacetum coccineum]
MKNRLMRIDELHKFSDGTLNDVWSALDDILNKIQMEYLPQTVWRNVDRERVGAMIQAIDRQLRNRSYKAVRHRYSNRMIQPEPEGSTQGYPLVSVEVLRYNTKGEKVRIRNNAAEMELTLEQTQQGVSYEVSYDESNTYVLERFNTTAGNPVKKILLKLNLSDHRILKYGGEDFRYSDTERLSQSDEVLKLKNFKKDATLKLFKSTNQERYEHVSPEVTSSQDGKVYKMAKRDYAWLMITRCSRSHS